MPRTIASGEIVPREMVSGRSVTPPADYIGETRRLYDSLGYESYRWAHNTDTPPWAPVTKALSDCTVMLIGSGGIYRHGQVAFHTKDDTSIRLIAAETDAHELRTAHFAYDQADARADPDCIFPIDTLRSLADDGVIGGLTNHHLAFMGGIYSTRRVLEDLAPRIVDVCAAAQPDLILLVPV